MTDSTLVRSGAALLAMMAGCVDSVDRDDDSVDAIERCARSEIHGSDTLFGITSRGIVHQPVDVSSMPVATYSFVHGDLVKNDGVGHADGTFTAPIEPCAHRWELEVNPFGVPLIGVGDARHPTLDRYVLGRLDTVLPTSETDVTMNITGMTPWAAGDATEIMVPNTGSVVFNPELQIATPPAIGDTALAGTFDWSAQFGDTLTDPTRGDVAMVEQLVAHTSGSETYSTLERAGTAAGFAQTDGAPSTLSVDLHAVPLERARTVHWRGAGLAALASEVGAGAFTAAAGLFLDPLPDADRFGFYSAAPDLVLYTPSAFDATADFTVRYGNPYRSMGRTWDEFFTVQYVYVVPVQLGDAQPGFEVVSYQTNTAVDGHDIVVTPRISPARNVRIAPPFVRWDAPAIGHANQYFVSLDKLTVVDGKTTVTAVVQFQTRDRELQVPSAYLEPGSTYVFRIFADDFGDLDRTKDLFGDGLPVALAGMVTETFTP